MTTKQVVLQWLKKGFLHCALPCNERVAELIKDLCFTDPEIIDEPSSNNDTRSMIVRLPYSDDILSYRFTIGVGLNGMANTCLSITEIL